VAQAGVLKCPNIPVHGNGIVFSVYIYATLFICSASFLMIATDDLLHFALTALAVFNRRNFRATSI
jgi:hypothetical protein